MNERELKINQIAQGLVSLADGLEWFDGATPDFRLEIMRSLDLCIFQSHPTIEDIEQGIKKSGLKESYSPCVLIRKKPFNQVRQKILEMPELDLRRGFVLLISVFSVADLRRRETQCKGGCTHDWHNIGL
jgi:hypothetical protein